MALCEAASLLSSQKFAMETASSMLEIMQEKGVLKSPEGIVVWLEIANNVKVVQFPPGIWHKNNPLCAKEISTVAKILHAVKLGDDEQAAGSRQLSPHFAWRIILSHLSSAVNLAEKKEGAKAAAKASKTFAQFWIEAIDSE
jgi:hypothetical protein